MRLTAFGFLLFALPHVWISTARSQGPVPGEFRALYDELDAKLSEIDGYVSQRWDRNPYPVVFSTELLVANSNRGEVLLNPQTLQATILTLDRLKFLGVTGVSVAIDYPILVPAFPRAAEYLAFYTQVAREIRLRGMVLLVGAQTIFPNPAYSSLPVDYTGLTIARYKQEKRRMIELLIDEVRPDYLTIENEPKTMEMNTKLDFSVDNVREIMQHILSGLDRKGVKLGAGAGTWDDFAYVQMHAQLPIDFLDMHIYPLQRDWVIDRAVRVASLASLANKRLVLGEAWLYKASEQEIVSRIATDEQIFARDPFDFWIPLDRKYLMTMVPLLHWLKCDFASFFWMKYFYGYLPYNDSTRVMTPAQMFAASDAAAAPNILLNRLTPTGETYKALIAGQTGAPQVPAGLRMELHQNHPNPFRSETMISVTLGSSREVTLTLYDLLGNVVHRFCSNTRLSGGRHSFPLDGTGLPPGVYLCRLSSIAGESRAMVLSKR